MNWMILPLKRYAEFSGRSRRMEYWMFALFQFAIYMVFAVIFGSVLFSALASGGAASIGRGSVMSTMFASMGIAFVLIGLFWLAMLIPAIAVAVRRLHDTDRSGWWLMLYVGPYLVSLVFRAVAIGSGSGSLLAVVGVLGLLNLICGIVLLVFMCLPGTVGANRFGADPMFADRDFAETFR